METFTTKLIKDGAGHKEVFNKMKEKLVELNNEQDGTKEFKRNKRKIMKDLKVHTAGVTGNRARNNKRKLLDETTKAMVI